MDGFFFFVLLLTLVICISIARALDTTATTTTRGVLRIDGQKSPLLTGDERRKSKSSSSSTSATSETTTFVGTIDGMVHAIDAQTGRQLWSFSSGDALFASSVSLQQQPSSTSSAAPVFIPGVDGTIFAHAADQKLRRLPITVKDLVAKSPFQTGDGTILVGRKESRVFVLDRHTGAMLRTFGNNEKLELFESSSGGGNMEPLTRDTIVIGRSDYHVSALDPISGALAWNMSSGEYSISLQNNGNKQSLTQTSIEESNDSDDDQRHVKFPLVVGADGSLQMYDTANGVRLWRTNFDATVVSAFGQVANRPIRRLPHISVPNEHGPIKTPSATTKTSDALVPLNRQQRDSNSNDVSNGVVIVGTWANKLFAFECPAIDEVVVPLSCSNAINGDDSEFRCLLGAHAIYDAGSTLLLPPMPVYPQITSGVNESIDAHRMAPNDIIDSSSSSSSSSMTVVDSNSSSSSIVIITTLILTTILSSTAALLLYWRRNVKALTNAVASTKPTSTTTTTANSENSNNNNVVEITPQQTSPTTISSSSTTTSISISPTITVGVLTVHRDRVLGHGSGGTMVYDGEWQGRKVAVKRLLLEFHDIAQQEIELLLAADETPHIVRYYAQERDDQFIYLALAHCERSLASRIASIDDENLPLLTANEALSISHDIVEGVCQLHALNIAHRDLKPANVLLARDGTAKLSDMGLARRFDADSSSFSTDRGVGSIGWQAPELLLRSGTLDDTSIVSNNKRKLSSLSTIAPTNRRLTKQVDLFSLGCLLYFTLTNGLHPFGDTAVRVFNIARDQTDLSGLKGARCTQMPSKRIEARALIASLLNALPERRPSAAHARRHPMLWSAAMRLAFIGEASDRVEADISRLKASSAAATITSSTGTTTSSTSSSTSSTTTTTQQQQQQQQSQSQSPNSIRNNSQQESKSRRQLRRSELAAALERNAYQITGDDRYRNNNNNNNNNNNINSNRNNSNRFFARSIKNNDANDFRNLRTNNCASNNNNNSNSGSNGWLTMLPAALVSDATQHRQYHTGTVRDLLRLVRNKAHHFRELDANVRALLGEADGGVPDGYMKFWDTTFPSLVLHTWLALKSFCAEEQEFSNYYVE